MCVCACVCMCVCVYMTVEARRDSGPLELELCVTMKVLGIEPKSSGQTISAHNY